jgi:hypothetical protein
MSDTALAHLQDWLTRPEQGVDSVSADVLVQAIQAFHSYASTRLRSRVLLAISGRQKGDGRDQIHLRLDFVWPDGHPDLEARAHHETSLRTAFTTEVGESPTPELSVELHFVEQVAEAGTAGRAPTDGAAPPEAHFLGLHGLTSEEEAYIKQVVDALAEVGIQETLSGLFKPSGMPPETRWRVYDLIQGLAGKSEEKQSDLVDQIGRLVGS